MSTGRSLLVEQYANFFQFCLKRSSKIYLPNQTRMYKMATDSEVLNLKVSWYINIINFDLLHF